MIAFLVLALVGCVTDALYVPESSTASDTTLSMSQNMTTSSTNLNQNVPTPGGGFKGVKSQSQGPATTELGKALREGDGAKAQALVAEAKAKSMNEAALLVFKGMEDAHGWGGNGGTHNPTKGIEGHSDELVQTQLRSLLTDSTKTICEIGFNGGHSAANYLLAAPPDAKYIGFDLGEHDYVPRAKQYVETMFPGRVQLVLGSSLETVTKFAKENPNTKCNYLMVDGGHTEEMAAADLKNMMSLAACDHVLAIDDINLDAVLSAWAKAEKSGIVLSRKDNPATTNNLGVVRQIGHGKYKVEGCN